MVIFASCCSFWADTELLSSTTRGLPGIPNLIYAYALTNISLELSALW